ncbi:probable G-protein coupled receptor Mth-like 5 [Periplaneta americana]|uniref:probable G-protein coupled receptor Mth-like 5 n=1 Tax=Periplaneta americana TaxID=6978 RepID=UPI0037E925E1
MLGRLLLIQAVCVLCSTAVRNEVQDRTKKDEKQQNLVRVHKCCERFEVMVDQHCVDVNETHTGLWSPMFTGEDGQSNLQLSGFKLVIGIPHCQRQLWPIYHYQDSPDRLVLLQNGVLRHYVSHPDSITVWENDLLQKHHNKDGDTLWYFDYKQGTYCMDRGVLDGKELELAIVCDPEKEAENWDYTDFIMCRIVNPVCHGLAIVCYIIIAIVYFVIPQLRDLVGNILTSISLCLITSQAADSVRIFTEFSSHVSFLVADIVMYVSLMAAFFWLNSLGYYIWKTFRSRNVFLRVTDGRKYCYYSCYAWSMTLTMACIALFAHFMLDTTNLKEAPSPPHHKTIGWLGKAVFFTPVAFTVVVNIFFYLTTGHVINQMSTYGRIHHKMKYSFELFVKLFLTMVISWLLLLLSWLHYPLILYIHIVVNAFVAILILYICILGQRRVMFLLKQYCCCCQEAESVDTVEWGEEMSSINTANY